MEREDYPCGDGKAQWWKQAIQSTREIALTENYACASSFCTHFPCQSNSKVSKSEISLIIYMHEGHVQEINLLKLGNAAGAYKYLLDIDR